MLHHILLTAQFWGISVRVASRFCWWLWRHTNLLFMSRFILIHCPLFMSHFVLLPVHSLLSNAFYHYLILLFLLFFHFNAIMRLKKKEILLPFKIARRKSPIPPQYLLEKVKVLIPVFQKSSPALPCWKAIKFILLLHLNLMQCIVRTKKLYDKVSAIVMISVSQRQQNSVPQIASPKIFN